MPYIFRAPTAAYDLPLVYADVVRHIRKGYSQTDGKRSRKLGTTITLVHDETLVHRPISVVLYDTTIAWLWADGTVVISEEVNEFGSQATTWWLQKILRDNDIPGLVVRKNHKYPIAGIRYKLKEYA